MMETVLLMSRAIASSQSTTREEFGLDIAALENQVQS